ncbi:hypothetical protein GCM10011369_22610 [Neiella marina]|uniref:CAAX prenyl protease 2/Lysostaphin resistance protein A-like domain-containing protein n=1 Tax=Neiella marina TaxID=508461 RepID=A0A8J2U5T2_9GAMM|nr:type II CAAX endopeptidase family protein [Neiella marina]GGA80121.1 hypothetical protein GCM10011369_22610 [Neiella marina]
MEDDCAFPLKSRYVFLALLFASIIFVILSASLNLHLYWQGAADGMLFYLVAGMLLAALIVWRSIPLMAAMQDPSWTDYIAGFKLSLFSVLFSIAAVYVFYYPLSFWLPDWVSNQLLEGPDITYDYRDGDSFVPNTLSFAAIVVLAPIVEEIVFRFLLLHRWADKWGGLGAAIGSSVLFAGLHTDVIGSLMFGLCMCALYIKTGTLFAPIFCHMCNNLLAWLYSYGAMVLSDLDQPYTLQDFQSEWYIGVTCGVIALAWAYRFLSQQPAYTSILSEQLPMR